MDEDFLCIGTSRHSFFVFFFFFFFFFFCYLSTTPFFFAEMNSQSQSTKKLKTST